MWDCKHQIGSGINVKNNTFLRFGFCNHFGFCNPIKTSNFLEKKLFAFYLDLRVKKHDLDIPVRVSCIRRKRTCGQTIKTVGKYLKFLATKS